MKHKAAVLSCSDLAIENPDEDRAGPVLRSALESLGFEVLDPLILPLECDLIGDQILASIGRGARVIMTAGGTGLQPRDVVVEATVPLLTYELPGIMDEVRRIGAEKTNLALLSRGVAGVVIPKSGLPAVIVNAPGSRGGARDTMRVAGAMLEHMIGLLDGADHDMNRPDSID